AAVDGLVSGLPLLVSDAAGGESGGRLVGGGGVPCRAEPLGQARGEGRQAEFVGCRVRDHSPVVEQQGRGQPVALAHRRKCGPAASARVGPADGGRTVLRSAGTMPRGSSTTRSARSVTGNGGVSVWCERVTSTAATPARRPATTSRSSVSPTYQHRRALVPRAR